MYSTLQQLLGELLQRRSFRDHPSSSFLETKAKYDDGSDVEWQIWIKRGKSYWVSSDLVYIRHLINQTIANPDQTEPHNDDHDKIVLKKNYSVEIGKHG